MTSLLANFYVKRWRARYLVFLFGPRFRGFASACFRYSASRRSNSVFGTDNTLSTMAVKVSYSLDVAGFVIGLRW
jgi:hypothetical protein